MDIVAIFRGRPRRPACGTSVILGDRDPLRTLDERFARGEIHEEEYHARQKVLPRAY